MYKSRIVKIIILILAILVPVGVSIAFRNNSGSIQSSTVTYDDQFVQTDVTGYVSRDELTVSLASTNTRSSLIKKSGDSIFGLIVSDGDYVSYNQEIAHVFSSKKEYKNYRLYLEKQNELEVVKRLAEYSADTSNTDSINLEITSLIRQYIDYLDENDFSDDFSDNLRDLAYQIDTKNPSVDVTASVSSISKQLDEYASKIDFSKTIKSPSAGYFCNEVDGLESKSDYKNVVDNGIGVKKLKSLLKCTPKTDDDYLGKIVYQNNWYFSFIVPSEFAGEYLKRGSSIKVSFPNSGIRDIPMTVSKKVRSGAETSVSCLCSRVTPELLHLRVEDATVTAKSIKGFRVSNNSLETVDGITGVYVNVGNRVVFKPIDKIYGTESYSIVSAVDRAKFTELYGEDKLLSFLSDISKDHYKTQYSDAKNNNDEKKLLNCYDLMYSYDNRLLSDYDIVIVNGRNLYDGKFIS